MKTKTIKELNEKYDLELNRIVSQIKKQKSKLVLLQFPDGLKPYATCIVDYLSEKTKAEFLIWFGTCFGACDTPAGLEKIKPKIDLVIQFGHNEMMPNF
jgi:2-(3-amino-3-carboxypropyl)histidine synthase